MPTHRLMIVESPSKAKTIQRYVGSLYRVKASYGHCRDLIPKKGAVEVLSGDVLMRYQMIARSKAHVDELCAEAEKAKEIFLATDPDREGEAIAYHLQELFKSRMDLSNKIVKRVVFHEISPKAVEAALLEPRELDMNLVNAQQARRAMDYLVGFNLSPVLWKKVRPGLSAGRVQSPALRLIADREKEITQFQSREYWSVQAQLTHHRRKVDARLYMIQDQKIGQFQFPSKESVDSLVREIESDKTLQWLVQKIQNKERKKQPVAPFTTSTLQQEAARKLGFSSSQTMRIAQQLYEGVDIGVDSIALITYLRTDSVSLSDTAIAEIRTEITERFGKAAIPSTPRSYKNKSKNAQEAHEAIRPIDIKRDPEGLKNVLSQDQYRLYQLIWLRTISSQMVDAIFQDQIVSIRATERHLFEARKSCIKREGFLVVYQEGLDSDDEECIDRKFLAVEEGDKLIFQEWITKQHFTEPPARFNEATLVKALESYGIGRPSTYSSIISTLKQRDYVEFKQKRFNPTDIGVIVNDFLKKYFVNYVDYDFTASMEDQLDLVSLGETKWTALVENFWTPFSKIVDHVSEKISKKEVTQEEIDENCPECGHQLVRKFGKAGRFIGCSHYPECSYTRPVEGESQLTAPPLEKNCPQCEKPLQYKRGRFGMFIGCSGYPECRYIESTRKNIQTGLTCPTCQKGEIVGKTSRRGTVFYACSEYPSCSQTYSGKPRSEKCSLCSYPLLIEKNSKKDGNFLQCPVKECGFKKPTE